MSGWNMHNLVIPNSERHLPSGRSSSHKDGEASRHAFHTDASGDFARISGPTFCTKENILNSVGYINQELELMGFSVLRLDSSQGCFDTVSFINRMYDLLKMYHKTIAAKESMEERNHKLQCESEHRQGVHLRLKHQQQQSDRDLAKEQEKCRQLNVKYKQVCSRLKVDRDECKRLTAAMQSKEIQHRHEVKKMERETQKLKERLTQLLADKVPDRKVGMDIMHVVGSSEGRRATWKVGPEKQEEEMYQLLISNYEDRHSENMQENAELRDCLLALHRELAALLKRTGDMSTSHTSDGSLPEKELSSEEDSEDSLKKGPKLCISDLSEGYFQMPYDIVKKEVTRTFKETCEQITDSMKKSLVRTMSKGHQSSTSSSFTDSRSISRPRADQRGDQDMEKLKAQVSKYKTIMQQQEEIIQLTLFQQSLSRQVPPAPDQSFLRESHLLKEKENLSEQKRLFFEEKANFEKERQAYTEAAIRLGKERQSLKEERASYLKQQFLNASPFKDSQKYYKGGTGSSSSSSRFLPATPNFSPANGYQDVDSPQDLYRMLGLSYPKKSPEPSQRRNSEEITREANIGLSAEPKWSRSNSIADPVHPTRSSPQFTPSFQTPSVSSPNLPHKPALLSAPTTLAESQTISVSSPAHLNPISTSRVSTSRVSSPRTLPSSPIPSNQSGFDLEAIKASLLRLKVSSTKLNRSQGSSSPSPRNG